MMKIFNNEELVFDMDDLMEQELANFNKVVKSINKDEIKQFKNWLKLYKTLNYDIIDSLEIKNIFRFNACAAVIELKFNNKTEYDLLYFNAEDMTVSCMNVRKNNVRNYMVRRMLIPTTVEEALMYAKSELTEKTINSISKTIDKIKTESDKYMVTSKLIKHLNIKGKEQIEEQQPEVKEEIKEEQQPEIKEEVKEQQQPEVKEEVKEQQQPEVKEEVKEQQQEVKEETVDINNIIQKSINNIYTINESTIYSTNKIMKQLKVENEPSVVEEKHEEVRTGLLVDAATVLFTPLAFVSTLIRGGK